MSLRDDDEILARGKSARDRRERIRLRHDQAAKDGIHLPSVHELLAGGSFMGADIATDAKIFVERLLPRVDQSTLPGAEVHAALLVLTCHPNGADFKTAAAACLRAVKPRHYVDAKNPADALYHGPNLWSISLRLNFYGAAFGEPDACFKIAAYAIEHAGRDGHADVTNKMLKAAVGWLSVAREARETAAHRGGFAYWDAARYKADRDGDQLLEEFLRFKARVTAEDEAAKNPDPAAVVFRGRGRLTLADVLNADPEFDFDDNSEPEPELVSTGVVVIQEVGSPGTHDGKRIAEAYKSITAVHLPLPPTPNLVILRRDLLAEFPHAASVIDGIIRGLDGREHVRLKPTIFVGKPGSGKTTFAAKLLKALGIGHQIYPCGGVSDASFAGTARQWSTGTPSLPVSLVARFRTAAPGIILDEVGRTGTGRQNGSLMDCLLSMLEPVSACRHLDPYLQTECDLSAVVWLATANDLEGVPEPLRDRCRIISFPSPGVEHLSTLANSILKRAVEELGLSVAWATPLDGIELTALAAAWPGGSMRGLRKLVEAVLAARDVVGMARA